MNKNIRNLLLFAAVVFGISLAASNVRAQDITGGYGDTAVTDKDAVASAKYAVKAQAHKTHKTLKLVKIEKAQVQVVAGLNYRVCMTVREARRKAKKVTAVVYKDLKNNLSLSRWKAGGCTDL